MSRGLTEISADGCFISRHPFYTKKTKNGVTRLKDSYEWKVISAYEGPPFCLLGIQEAHWDFSGGKIQPDNITVQLSSVLFIKLGS